MRNHPAAPTGRQSEGVREEPVLGDLRRLDRRHFLQSGALTVAGLATLSGVELVRPPLAVAQQNIPAGASPVSNLQLLSATATAVPGQQALQVCRHSYQFDFNIGTVNPPTVPPDLVQTYRLNTDPDHRVIPGFALADQMQVLMQVPPFNNPAAAPANPFPQPSGGPAPGGALLPDQLRTLVCYRLVQFIDLQTFPVTRIARVFDWCSLYCFAGNIIVIGAGDRSVCYTVRGGANPPPAQQTILNDSPQLTDIWYRYNLPEPSSIGGFYFYTYNSQQGAFSTATWRSTLNLPGTTTCRVDAFIPGAAVPANRTARARYMVSNTGFTSPTPVTISQQIGTSQWVTLGNFPFVSGIWEVRLTDETGEPQATKVIVADAVRWVCPA